MEERLRRNGSKDRPQGSVQQVRPKEHADANAIAYDQDSVKANADIATGAEPINIDAFDVEYIDNPDSDTVSEEMAEKAKEAATTAQARARAAMAAATNPNEIVDTDTDEIITKPTKK